MNSPAAATASPKRHLAAVPDAGGLFAAYSSQIFAYCLHNLGSRSDAEDALQTTFLQAHRALQRGVVPECESAWLTAIAKNACRWQRRTRARRATSSEGELDVSTLPAPADDDSRGAVADLKDALASIPERQRRALLLREWQGLQPNEIAPQLGATTSETYALLARARRSVASALTAAARRPVLGIDFGSFLLQLRSLLASEPAAVGATAAVIAGVGVAGVTIERAADHQQAKMTPAVVSEAPAAVAPSGLSVVRAKKHGTSLAAAAQVVPRSHTSTTSTQTLHAPRHAVRAAVVPRATPPETAASPSEDAESKPAAESAAAPAPAQPASTDASSPARVATAPPTVPPLPDPAVPVQAPPPVSTLVSTVVSTVNDTLQPPDQTPPATSDPSPAPLPPLPLPVGGLVP